MTISYEKIKPDMKRIAAGKGNAREVLRHVYNDGIDVFVTDACVALRMDRNALTDLPIEQGEGINVHDGSISSTLSYPQVSRLFPDTENAEVHVRLTKSQAVALKQTLQDVKKAKKDVKNTPAKIEVKARGLHVEDAVEIEVIEANGVGTAHFNAKLLEHVLLFAKKITKKDEIITLSLFGRLRPAHVTSETGEWEAVIMPVRVGAK